MKNQMFPRSAKDKEEIHICFLIQCNVNYREIKGKCKRKTKTKTKNYATWQLGKEGVCVCVYV